MSTKTKSQAAIARPLSYVLKSSFALLLLALLVASSQAGSATWKLSPTAGDWNKAGDWSPATVPNGASDIATFGTSNVTNVSVSAPTEINSMVFNPGASGFTITVKPFQTLTISGAGVNNSSAISQNIVSDALPNDGGVAITTFTGNATAGDNSIYTDNGLIFFEGSSRAGTSSFIISSSGAQSGMNFRDSSSADQGTFVLNSGTAASHDGAALFFSDSSTAGDATITLNGPDDTTALGSAASFILNSTADNATIILNGGQRVDTACAVFFSDSSNPKNATLIANSGVNGGAGTVIKFFEVAGRNSSARVEVFGNGRIDISSQRFAGGVKFGSIEGDGLISLGAKILTVGGSNSSTLFSGVISDDGGDVNASGGSLTKIGSAELTLAKANTYTGGTIIEGGALLALSQQGSATGSGPVQVNAGAFGGRSNITGAVTLGSGSGTGAFLSPGINGPGTLVIRNTLTFKSDGTYNCDLSLTKSKADQVVCKGVTIESGAQFALNAQGNQTLANGTVFTVLENKSRQHTSGTFSNLPDHSTFSANGNTFQVNYEGGDGNDLSLTVVP